MTQDHKTLLTFVYGTLRPGLALYHLIEPAVLKFVDDCTTPGALYVVNLPYADFNDDAGLVHGTMLVLDRTVELHGVEFAQQIVTYVRDMEIAAGYEARQVPVTGPSRRGAVQAEAWHYPRIRPHWWASRVPSGDYLDHRLSRATHQPGLRAR